MLNVLTFIVNNGWKVWGKYVEMKGNSNFMINIPTRKWSFSNEVIHMGFRLVSKFKRFRRQEKTKIKFTWVNRDMEAQSIED